MSTALATKLEVARIATVAACNQAIEDDAGRDLIELLQSAIYRIDEAEYIRPKEAE